MDDTTFLETALGRLLEARTLIEVIEDHDLLAMAPSDARARDDHQRAASLISILRRELDALAGDLEAAVATRNVLGLTG